MRQATNTDHRGRSGFPGTLAAMVLCLGLAGCVSVDLAGKQAKVAVAQFDLGAAMRDEGVAPAIGLRSIEVVSPSWLDTPAMQYRLAYADASRRASFAESRWVAPPPELVQQALRRALASGGTASPAGLCRLVVEIDEFIQRFDSPQSSAGVIDLRVALLGPRGDAALARRGFRLTRGAATADARGGVASLAAATAEAAASIRSWLDDIDRDGGSRQLGRACRAEPS